MPSLSAEETGAVSYPAYVGVGMVLGASDYAQWPGAKGDVTQNALSAVPRAQRGRWTSWTHQLRTRRQAARTPRILEC